MNIPGMHVIPACSVEPFCKRIRHPAPLAGTPLQYCPPGLRSLGSSAGKHRVHQTPALGSCCPIARKCIRRALPHSVQNVNFKFILTCAPFIMPFILNPFGMHARDTETRPEDVVVPLPDAVRHQSTEKEKVHDPETESVDSETSWSLAALKKTVNEDSAISGHNDIYDRKHIKLKEWRIGLTMQGNQKSSTWRCRISAWDGISGSCSRCAGSGGLPVRLPRLAAEC